MVVNIVVNMVGEIREEDEFRTQLAVIKETKFYKPRTAEDLADIVRSEVHYVPESVQPAKEAIREQENPSYPVRGYAAVTITNPARAGLLDSEHPLTAWIQRSFVIRDVNAWLSYEDRVKVEKVQVGEYEFNPQEDAGKQYDTQQKHLPERRTRKQLESAAAAVDIDLTVIDGLERQVILDVYRRSVEKLLHKITERNHLCVVRD